MSIVNVSYIGTADTTAQYVGKYDSQAAMLAELGIANEYGVTGQDFYIYNTKFDQYFANEDSVYTDTNISGIDLSIAGRSPSR